MSANGWILLLTLICSIMSHLAHADDGVLQILGGEEIGDNEYFWFCALRDKENNSNFICSGSLVGARFVLTAEHCLRTDPDRMEIEVGYLCRRRDNCDRDNDSVDVERVFRHPEGGDMALLLLKRPISIDVVPAVPYLGPSLHGDVKPLKKGRRMKLVGAGREGTGGEITFRVQKLSVRSIKTKKCSKTFSNPDFITPFTTCSVALDGNPCSGDSGGALVVRGKGQWKRRDVIMAIHKFGYRDCSGSVNRPIGHFLITNGADLLQDVVCSGTYGPPEDWCVVPPPTVNLLHTLTGGHRSGADSVAFNIDGSRLISGGEEDDDAGSIFLWDPVSGGPPLANAAVQRWVYSTAFHPSDSSLIASISRERYLDLWTADADGKLSLVTRLQDSVSCCMRVDVAWHPSGSTLVATSIGSSIGVWNVLTGIERKDTITTDQGDTIRSMTFNHDGSLLGSAGGDGTIKLWQGDTFALVKRLRVPGGDDALSIAFSHNGEYLAAGCVDTRVRIWEVETGKLLHTLRGHELPVRSVDWSPDGRYVVSGSFDGKLRIWDGSRGGDSLVVLDSESERVRSVDWSPNGALIAAGLWDGQVKIWRVQANP